MKPISEKVTDKPAAFRLLYPDARKISSDKLKVGSVLGEPGQSAVIYLETGYLFDHNGSKSFDLIDCIRHVEDCDYNGAISWLKKNNLFDDRDDQKVKQTFDRKVVEYKRSMQLAPADAPPPKKTQIIKDAMKQGKFAHAYVKDVEAFPYRNADGRIALVQTRVNLKTGKKHLLRYTWAKNEHVPAGGIWKLGGSRDISRIPVYNLIEALEKSEAVVIIVEGEKAVNAGRKNAPAYAWVSALETNKTDFRWIKDRSVIYIPDCDPTGLVTKANEVFEKIEKKVSSWKFINLPVDLFELSEDQIDRWYEDNEGFDVADLSETDWPKLVSLIEEVSAPPTFTVEELAAFIAEEVGARATRATAFYLSLIHI